MGGESRTVCTMGPDACGARLMTCIWAAARLASSDSAEMYFIMTRRVIVVKGRKIEAPALQTNVLNCESRRKDRKAHDEGLLNGCENEAKTRREGNELVWHRSDTQLREDTRQKRGSDRGLSIAFIAA